MPLRGEGSCGGGGAPRDSAGSGATEEGLTSKLETDFSPCMNFTVAVQPPSQLRETPLLSHWLTCTDLASGPHKSRRVSVFFSSSSVSEPDLPACQRGAIAKPGGLGLGSVGPAAHAAAREHLLQHSLRTKGLCPQFRLQCLCSWSPWGMASHWLLTCNCPAYKLRSHC